MVSATFESGTFDEYTWVIGCNGQTSSTGSLEVTGLAYDAAFNVTVTVTGSTLGYSKTVSESFRTANVVLNVVQRGATLEFSTVGEVVNQIIKDGSGKVLTATKVMEDERYVGDETFSLYDGEKLVTTATLTVAPFRLPTPAFELSNVKPEELTLTVGAVEMAKFLEFEYELKIDGVVFPVETVGEAKGYRITALNIGTHEIVLKVSGSSQVAKSSRKGIDWYNLKAVANGESIFEGVFVVEAGIIQGVFETINTTIEADNLLVPLKDGVIGSTVVTGTREGGVSAEGFKYYYSTMTTTKPSGTLVYVDEYGADNAFVEEWKQFDYYGIFLTNTRYNPDCVIAMFSQNVGDQLTSNVGTVETFVREGQGEKELDKLSVHFEISKLSESPYGTPLISNICFPKGTKVTCDQGTMSIEELTKENTFGGYEVEAVTATVTLAEELVEFVEGCLAPAVPNKVLRMSKDHAILWEGKMRKASSFAQGRKVPYDGSILYNVLLKDVHGLMNVQGVACETLHPENSVAKYYRASVKQTVQEWNEYVMKNAVYA